MWPPLYYKYIYFVVQFRGGHGVRRQKVCENPLWVYLNSNANYYTLHPCFSGKVEDYEIGDEDLKTLSLWFQSVNSFFYLNSFFLNPQTYFCICSQYFLCCFRPKRLRNNQTNRTIRTGSTLLYSWMSLITSAFKLPPQTIQNLETYRCLQRMFTAATHRKLYRCQYNQFLE